MFDRIKVSNCLRNKPSRILILKREGGVLFLSVKFVPCANMDHKF